MTADVRGTGGRGGFYLQPADPDNDQRNAEGLFVFTDSSAALQPGNYVQATGTVTEFRRNAEAESLTRLAGNPVVERCGTVELIKSTTLTWEGFVNNSLDGLGSR